MSRPPLFEKKKKTTTHVRMRKSTARSITRRAEKEKTTVSDILDLLIKNKKGQLSDLGVFIVSIFSIMVIVLLAWVASDAISDGFRNAGFNDTAEAENVISGIEDVGKAGDVIFSIGLFGLTLALILSAILIPTNIVFLTIYIMGVLFLWVLSPILSNVYESLTAAGTISTAASALPITNTIMLNFPVYMTFLVMIIIIILYGKGGLDR